MSLFLNSDELVELTGKRHKSLQVKILANLRRSDGKKVVFTVRPTDGFPLVERWQFDRPEQRREPRFAEA